MFKHLPLFVAALVVVLLCWWSAAFAQPVRDPQPPAIAGATARVAGVVTTTGGRPLRSVRLTLVESSSRAARSAMSDFDGRFEFPSVPPGDYVLSGSKAGYVAVSFGELMPGAGRGATPIHLSAGQRFDARLEMPAGGVVTGRIVDERGDPAPRVVVRALKLDSRASRRPALPVGNTTTDDRGIYRIFGLSPGEYLACATPTNEPDLRSTLPAALAQQGNGPTGANEESDVSRGGYAPVCYPGGTAAGGSARVRVAAGQERTGLDFQLDVVPLSYVEGMVVGAPEGVRTQVSLVDVADTLRAIAPPSVQATADGYFKIVNVPSGSYQLVAQTVSPAPRASASSMAFPASAAGPDAPSLWGAVDLAVAGRAVRDAVVTLRPGMTVSGHVMYLPTRPPALPLDLTRAVARLVPAEGGSAAGELARQVSARVQADGTFRLTGVTPGVYRLIATSEGSWILQSAILDRRDTLDFPVEIKPGQDLTGAAITFTDLRTSLSGSVEVSRDTEAATPTVVLFAADPQFWTPSSRRVLSTRVSTDGRYTFREVPPGAYRIAAIRLADPDRLSDAQFLESIEPNAMELNIAAGEQKTQVVPFRPSR